VNLRVPAGDFADVLLEAASSYHYWGPGLCRLSALCLILINGGVWKCLEVQGSAHRTHEKTQRFFSPIGAVEGSWAKPVVYSVVPHIPRVAHTVISLPLCERPPTDLRFGCPGSCRGSQGGCAAVAKVVVRHDDVPGGITAESFLFSSACPAARAGFRWGG